MRLTDEERDMLVALQMEKAETFLRQADEMFTMKYWDIAANRYYYACFHAAQALLIKNGLSAKTHAGTISSFGIHFVKTGKIELHLGSFLSRMEQLRQKGDYNSVLTVTEDDISTMKAPAKAFVEAIKKILESDY
ncbi:MAG: HEPN domain-containing protein [Mediterranea sp.]|jgi:uncharacterized protein (UPF0332 family)|nr:HEPN domain-containing protein [Mediterranea sp.]